jgi:conjugative transposon TraN protein
MKKTSVWVLLVLVCSAGNVFGQLSSDKGDRYQIESDSLIIGHSKTTTIVFPHAIKSVDRGSDAVLVQKVKGIENILQLKAAYADFNETNLTVVTSDGQLFSFVLNYNEKDAMLNWAIRKTKQGIVMDLGLSEKENEAELQSYAELAAHENRKLKGVIANKFGVKLQLSGLFIHQDVMYYRINVTNYSDVNYDISQFRFFIRDQKKPKRTASQEIEIIPSYIHNSVAVIGGRSEVCVVFALEKLTIPDKKYLAIQLMESKGARHLELQVRNKKMLQLAVLPSL